MGMAENRYRVARILEGFDIRGNQVLVEQLAFQLDTRDADYDERLRRVCEHGNKTAAREAELEALVASLGRALTEAVPLVDEYGCKTPVGHIATDCETVVSRARAALTPEVRAIMEKQNG